MSSRRGEIELSASEQGELIESERIVVVSTLGPRGWPHSMPLWYVPRDGEIWIYTYAKSQKVRNLERDTRATLQIEAGESYDQLRGVMFEATAELHHDTDAVAALGAEIMARYTDGVNAGSGFDEAILAQARKRVGLQFVVQRVASWDHRKLAGTY